MYKEIINSKTADFESAIDHMLAEFHKIRSGRANPALVEGIMVDYYGTPTPLKQVGNISVPEARQIVIQPFDRSMMENVEHAIIKADIGVNPSNEGDVIRITLPPMTEENRKDLVKVVGTKAEEARIRIRSIREDVMKELQAASKDGNISEDDQFAGKEGLQEIVDTYNARVEEARTTKEQDIMTV